MMEGIRFVTHITGLMRPNTGKDDDEDYNKELHKFEPIFTG
jgi:hypothetical protein